MFGWHVKLNVPKFVNQTLTLVTADVNSVFNVLQSLFFKATQKGTIVLGIQMTVMIIKNKPLKI